MKKAVIIVVLVALLGSILALVILAGSRFRGGTLRGSQMGTQPVEFILDGQLIAAKRKERPNGSFVVQIIDSSSRDVLLEGTRSVNPTTRWSMIEDGGNVWLYSSDIGMLVYTRGESGWEEVVWVPGKPSSTRFRIPSTIFSRMSKSDQESLAGYRQK